MKLHIKELEEKEGKLFYFFDNPPFKEFNYKFILSLMNLTKLETYNIHNINKIIITELFKNLKGFFGFCYYSKSYNKYYYVN